MTWCNEYSDLIIAIATVFVAVLTGVLAYYAYQQTEVAMRALELNSRPYLEINFIPKQLHIKSGEKMRMPIHMRNFGGVPAEVKIKAVVAYSPTRLFAPSISAGMDDYHTVFPKNPSHNVGFLYSADPLTEGQSKDIKAGTGYLYTRLLATYGLYHTEICQEYPLKESTGEHTFTMDITTIEDCQDPNSNNAK